MCTSPYFFSILESCDPLPHISIYPSKSSGEQTSPDHLIIVELEMVFISSGYLPTKKTYLFLQKKYDNNERVFEKRKKLSKTVFSISLFSPLLKLASRRCPAGPRLRPRVFPAGPQKKNKAKRCTKQRKKGFF